MTEPYQRPKRVKVEVLPHLVSVSVSQPRVPVTLNQGIRGPIGPQGIQGEPGADSTVPGPPGSAVITIEQAVPARQTAGNYEAVSQVAIAKTPFPGTTPRVQVNQLSYGASSGAWTFQRSGQDVLPTQVQAGDILVWRGATIGFDISADDEVTIIYEVAVDVQA